MLFSLMFSWLLRSMAGDSEKHLLYSYDFLGEVVFCNKIIMIQRISQSGGEISSIICTIIINT